MIVNGYTIEPKANLRGASLRAGCRDFTIDEALAHWGENYKGNREQGDMYLHAVKWLQQKVG